MFDTSLIVYEMISVVIIAIITVFIFVTMYCNYYSLVVENTGMCLILVQWMRVPTFFSRFCKDELVFKVELL